MTKQYRYPGAKPFETAQKHLFFGREKEIQELFELIQLEQLVVLFAKSGLGKSSLLNAGIAPKIEKTNNWESINLRFGAYTDGSKNTPLNSAKEKLKGQSSLLDKIKPKSDDRLWYRLKSRQLEKKKGKGFLLIMDQFEELFTYPESEIQAFVRQLSELLYTSIPDPYRELMRGGLANDKNFLTKADLKQLHEPLRIKIVVAIRSDRMSLLHKLKNYLPNILEK